MLNPIESWTETLHRTLQEELGAKAGHALWLKYQALFPPDYRELIAPHHAMQDAIQLERLFADGRQRIGLLEPEDGHTPFRLHFYSPQERYLDEFIPVLENLHLRVMDQVQFGFSVADASTNLKSFTVKPATGDCPALDRIKPQLLAAIQAVMDGRAENDDINRLVVLTGMAWQDCDVLRTYRNYYLQLDNWTTKASIHQALIGNPNAAHKLFEYFEARFRPDPAWQDAAVREEQVLFPLRLQLLDAIAAVANINHDRLLRIFFNLIDATVRSNFHLHRTQDDYFIAIKIASLGVIDMPAPKPQYEIYVHAVDMEGIHLRGGRISRGGIRWSDRIDDFRTEILDLMQTQISKNALIIPTGAKGGFVVKRSGPDALQAGKNAYLRLIRGMLDLTDNYRNGMVAGSAQIVAHDDPDPYLVIAADKGTAKFSDMANALAAEYRFWLGDAFASGGSHGYDHKALGITARGAWECIKRHFREMGKDIQTQEFTVVGIGSMDGDVFGNGMLLSPCIRLRAAFSGQHIFIDPHPAAADAAFRERKRLFESPGSSWNEYDRTLISSGGGVYARSDKDIPVSAELRKWLDIRCGTIDGETLIRHLLKAPTELLWLGGIGTYVKAATEKHEEVGDHGNDNVRVDAHEIRALVVGEGANLGFTQKARSEYALHGGRINTDAVDNSAGVDTSDHEVNLKILLSILERQGLIEDYQSLFINLTDLVCQAVLDDNTAQSLCLSLEQRRCAANPTMFVQVAERLETAGFLDRKVESFPEGKDILARPGQTLTRPELAVLMSAGKMYLTQQLENHGTQLQDPSYSRYLEAYFPAAFTEKFKAHLDKHPLANEIKATVISNRIINQAGSSFLILDENENGNTLKYVDAYLAFDQALQADGLRAAIAALDHAVPSDVQYELSLKLENILAEFCRWAAGQRATVCPDHDTVRCLQDFLADYEDYLHRQSPSLPHDDGAPAGVPAALANRIALIERLSEFPLMASLVRQTGRDFATVGLLLQDIDRTLGIRDIGRRLDRIPQRDYWVRTVCTALRDDLRNFSAGLVKKIVVNNDKSCDEYLERCAKKAVLNRYRKIRAENQKLAPANLLAYVTLVRTLGALVED